MIDRLTRLSLLPALAFAGCGGAPTLAIQTIEFESPAGPDSGEPYLSASGEAVWMSWLEAVDGGAHELRFARLEGDAWSEAGTIARSDRFFVNWADFPSVNAAADGSLWAHWLERGDAGGYDYGVRVVHSRDRGKTWSEPWTPHDDRSPTEHGFVSTLTFDDRLGFVWLDGRQHAEGPDGTPPTGEMTLRYRSISLDGVPGPEELVDGRVCDCCQTDAAFTASGPIVVYRDRSDEEIRDIYVTRLEDGAWTEGRAVHDDGWYITGCPVNGPAVAARGDDVVVAWFTGANDVPKVRAAISRDGGRVFGEPIEIDDGTPAGRVDVLFTDDESAVVSWLENGDAEGEAADVRVRRLRLDGTISESRAVTSSSGARASGFPRLARAPDGSVVMAWTDTSGDEPRVRVQRWEIDR